MRKIILTLLCLLFITSITEAAIVQLADCERATVNTAITNASTDDIIMLPAKDAIWSTPITLNKSVTIAGAGIGKTNITGVGFVTSGVNNWRITAISWNQNGYSSNEVIKVGPSWGSTNTNWRIDHCSFSNNNGINSIFTIGTLSGCIDNNFFYGGEGTPSYINVAGSPSTAWTVATNLGGSNFVFIEDNYFDVLNGWHNHFVTVGYGGRFVVRFNQFKESSTGYVGDWIDAHGYCHASDSTGRGARAYEIYNNSLETGVTKSDSAFFLRAGTGVIWGNNINETKTRYLSGGGYGEVKLRDERINNNAPTWHTSLSSCSSACNTSPDCTSGEGYPCCDQVGRGINQGSEPLYFWNNTTTYGDGSLTFIKTDYHYADASAYFTDGTDYKSNTPACAEIGYQPYTYPHPLRIATGETEITLTACPGVTTSSTSSTTTSATGTTTSSSTSTIWFTPQPSKPTGFKVRKKT